MVEVDPATNRPVRPRRGRRMLAPVLTGPLGRRVGGLVPWLLPGLLVLLLAAVLTGVGLVALDRSRDADVVAPTPADVGSRGSDGRGAGATAIDVARRAARIYFSLGTGPQGSSESVRRMRSIATDGFAGRYETRVRSLSAEVRQRGITLSADLPTDGTATEYLSEDMARILVSVDIERRSRGGGVVRLPAATRVVLQRDQRAHRWRVALVAEVGR